MHAPSLLPCAQTNCRNTRSPFLPHLRARVRAPPRHDRLSRRHRSLHFPPTTSRNLQPLPLLRSHQAALTGLLLVLRSHRATRGRARCARTVTPLTLLSVRTARSRSRIRNLPQRRASTGQRRVSNRLHRTGGHVRCAVCITRIIRLRSASRARRSDDGRC